MTKKDEMPAEVEGLIEAMKQISDSVDQAIVALWGTKGSHFLKLGAAARQDIIRQARGGVVLLEDLRKASGAEDFCKITRQTLPAHKVTHIQVWSDERKPTSKELEDIATAFMASKDSTTAVVICTQHDVNISELDVSTLEAARSVAKAI